jgi:phytoene synthase
VKTDLHTHIFRAGSTTYYNSTRFFPKDVREDVAILYGFVRMGDDYVDQIPPDTERFNAFCATYRSSVEGDPSGNIVIDSFIDLMERKQFERAWADAFLASMEMDLTVASYQTIEDLEEYLYGSSEVIGLMMARILDLPPKSYIFARHLGKAMQYINFIRDIEEDIRLGRSYFPQEEMAQYSLPDLTYSQTRAKQEQFRMFINDQLERYRGWQSIGESGFRYIPPSTLIPVKTASDMYAWTAEMIRREPFKVYERKVKPSVARIFLRTLTNTLKVRFRNMHADQETAGLSDY